MGRRVSAMKRLSIGISIVVLLCGSGVLAQDFERPPIEYSKRQPTDRVAQLMDAIKRGKQELKHDEQFGYLPAVLDALEVPRSSQMLVFSKTSLQRQRISPRTPRAIYFSDDIYIGYCQDGDVLEISTVDPQLGANFYTIEQADTPARVMRQGDNCLICHGSSSTRSVPGHVVRSVYADAMGMPMLSSGSYRTDHTSPFEQRWGGWYVTGTHGEQKHLGNFIVRGRSRPEETDNADGQNVTNLSPMFDTSDYLTPHSDIVALMVLEHQAMTHNAITYANFATQQALHFDRALSRDLGEESKDLRDSTKSRIKSGCEPLLEALLFCEEAPLTHKVTGTSDFAAEFTRRGPRDKQSRSLRDFDLTTRMFKHPCSYLIYSDAITQLPAEAKDFLFRRLHEILSGQDKTDKFKHLSAADRAAIHEILMATHEDYSKAASVP
jgi:hypothetical protein